MVRGGKAMHHPVIVIDEALWRGLLAVVLALRIRGVPQRRHGICTGVHGTSQMRTRALQVTTANATRAILRGTPHAYSDVCRRVVGLTQNASLILVAYRTLPGTCEST